MSKEGYKAICHTKCYWQETLWKVGDVYEGSEKPIEHFSKDGEMGKPVAPPVPGDDPRSTKEIIRLLKDKYHSSKPREWPRKKLWAALRDFETAASRDASTNPSTGSTVIESFPAKCGFSAKSQAGLAAHERVCEKCKEA
jgi:hypothetical protein